MNKKWQIPWEHIKNWRTTKLIPDFLEMQCKGLFADQMYAIYDTVMSTIDLDDFNR